MIPTPGIDVFPVRTPTLPPATHTNTYVVGEGALTVFDPASPWEDEQGRLADHLRLRVARGEEVERIVLTHHHADHVSGAEALRDALGGCVPILAHPETMPLVDIRVDISWADGETLDCGRRSLRAHHTPGHAPGHLVFHDSESGAIIAGDMIAGVGTIAIDPREGDLGDYLASLEYMRTLGGTVLLPAHGPALSPPDTVLSFYVAHRHQRTVQIREALDQRGRAHARALVADVYPELPTPIHPYAAAQITTHLHWLADKGLAALQEDGRWRAT